MRREESMYRFRCVGGGFPAVIGARVTSTIAFSFLRAGGIVRVGIILGGELSEGGGGGGMGGEGIIWGRGVEGELS